MENIQGKDHKALAAVLHYRVGQLEDKVEDNGKNLEVVAKAVAEVAGKVDTLIGLHKAQDRSVGAIEAVARLFERQPLLSVVFAVVVIALGSGGIISIVEAVSK